VLAALAALLIWAAPAAAATVTTSGSLLIRWQSNQQTCADHGLCGRSGSLSWRPSDMSTDSVTGSGFAIISAIGPDAVARSYRGESGSCIDRSSAPVDVIGLPPLDGQVVFSMRRTDTFSFGRCAGPLAADFMQALPESSPVSEAKLKSGGAVIDLRTRTPFSSGPFEGEVVSTLVMRTHREPRDQQGGSRSISGTLTLRPRGRKVRYGIVTATYAITALTGDAGYAFSGAPDPECAPFDTCGMSGELMLHPDVHSGQVTVTSVRRLGPGAHETTRAGLRAMSRGRTNVFGDTIVGPLDQSYTDNPFGVPLSVTATPGGGETCSDTGSYREPDLTLRRARGAMLMQLGHGGNTDPDPLRTRCPGPPGDDVGALASGALPLSVVGRRQVVLTLQPHAAFASVGFRGAERGQLQLSLKLQSLRAVTRSRAITREEGL
jgi:hypothetical protein